MKTQPLSTVLNLVQQKDSTIAVIEEDRCIGCFKCIQACPVDAIVGSPQKMHTVIKTECIGCDLCISACPVDCISTQPSNTPPDLTDIETRYQQKQARLETLANYEKQVYATHTFQNTSDPIAAKKAAIAEALKRVKQKS